MYATSLVCLGAKAKLHRRKPIVFVALLEISVDPNPNLFQDIWRTERVPIFVDVMSSQIVFASQGRAGHPHWMTLMIWQR